MKETAIFLIGALTIIMMIYIAISGDIQAKRIDHESIQVPISNGIASGYHTIVIDSCEYIEAFNKLAHKGNCRFCAERRRE